MGDTGAGALAAGCCLILLLGGWDVQHTPSNSQLY